MAIKTQLLEDLKTAMRARDKKRLDVLRLVTAAIKQVEVDERVEVDESRLLQILDKMSKQRKESIVQYKKANRLDLVEKEAFELEVLALYMPSPLGDAEVDALITQAIQETEASNMADMGKVMAWLKPKVQGRADMGSISQRIKSQLQ